MNKTDVRWFCGRTNVGIVRVQEDNNINYYISAIEGTDQERDIQFIKDYGARFPHEAGKVLFGY